jgi:hypothetical protein
MLANIVQFHAIFAGDVLRKCVRGTRVLRIAAQTHKQEGSN